MFILDASAVLASLRDEEGGRRVDEVIDGALMSTVNLCEVITHFAKQGGGRDQIHSLVSGLPCHFVSPSEEVAFEAGLMRKSTAKAGLSLGDRICLAEARRLDRVALTADRAWTRVADELGVRIELIR